MYSNRHKPQSREPVQNTIIHTFCVIRQDSALNFLPITVLYLEQKPAICTKNNF